MKGDTPSGQRERNAGLLEKQEKENSIICGWEDLCRTEGYCIGGLFEPMPAHVPRSAVLDARGGADVRYMALSAAWVWQTTE